MTEKRPVGAAMLALLALLTSLLGAFAVLSLWLTDVGGDAAPDLLMRSLAMGLVAVAFALLAWGFWGMRVWVRGVCIVVFVALGVAALLSADDSHVLELGAVLVLALGFLVNAVGLVYLKVPEIRSALRH